MKPETFNNLHVLIVDGKAGNARLLRGILLGLGVGNVAIAEDTQRAFDYLETNGFHVLFCDEGVGPLDAPAFALAVRRNGGVRNPRLPIVLISDGPQRAQVEAARDAGINDLIVRPLSMSSVQRKLLTLRGAPKTFVVAEAFVGPDRRREQDRRAPAEGAPSDAKPLRDRRVGPQLRRHKDPSTPGAN